MSDASYRILGLRPKASIDEVRVAYRRMAAQYHPDRNPGDMSAEDMFKLVIRAYRHILHTAELPPSFPARAPLSGKRTCRRKRSGTRSDRRYNWQLSDQYIGTNVNCKA
ncbi:J domain-containing protein [Teredinibacter franksiae]|jgi:DnaJ-class molecular chaperone with C-terminal Zn finger domain|uniref:J domain-containing protein n=1 Tax=Teredinibacter franksiae TaxID=2761453 RepID=UPI001628E67B|nr:J domain-containing protein [Teredinibacter franksiae]